MIKSRAMLHAMVGGVLRILAKKYAILLQFDEESGEAETMLQVMELTEKQ